MQGPRTSPALTTRPARPVDAFTQKPSFDGPAIVVDRTHVSQYHAGWLYTPKGALSHLMFTFALCAALLYFAMSFSRKRR